MTLADEAIARVLDAWPVARLATIGPGGRPHVVPIVFARVGERLWSTIDGKPKGGGEPARVRNLRRDPRATLLLDDYTTDWRALWWVRVDAVGRILHAPSLEEKPAAAAVAALRAKYPQYATVPVTGTPAVLLAFDVERVRSWRASDAAAP